MGALLQVQDLTVGYHGAAGAGGAVKALRHVDVDIEAGCIVGVVGESGCGKSTLISTLLRLLPPRAEVLGGRAVFQGRDLLSLSQGEMRALRGKDISVIFQDPMRTLNPVLSVGEQMINIQHRSRDSKAAKRRRAEKALQQVGIADAAMRLRQYPYQFSGGMLQRIAIAMAVMARPSLLIADEPTTALDATLEVQVIDILRDLQKEIGCAVLFVSHHLGVIAELCEQAMVMYAGEVVELGAVRDIFHRPAHPYTRRLLECDPSHAPRDGRELPTIAGEPPDLASPPPGCVFAPRCDRALPRCAHDAPPRFDGDGRRVCCWLAAE